MKKLFYLFTALAIASSNAMCAVVAYTYRGVLCDIEHAGFSAPASIAFLYAVPFAIAIAVSIALAVVFYKKSK